MFPGFLRQVREGQGARSELRAVLGVTGTRPRVVHPVALPQREDLRAVRKAPHCQHGREDPGLGVRARGSGERLRKLEPGGDGLRSEAGTAALADALARDAVDVEHNTVRAVEGLLLNQLAGVKIAELR